MTIEACVKCRKKMKEYNKKKVFKEILEFMKNPREYYVLINPETLFYKFEKIEKEKDHVET